MSKHGRFEKAKKKSGGKIVLIILLVLLLLILGLFGAGFLYYRNMLGRLNYVTMPPSTEPLYPIVQTEEPTSAPEAPSTEAPITEATTVPTTEATEPPEMKPEDIINILLTGQQAREGEESMLADTVMLVSINTYTKNVTLTSFFRDTYLNTPPYGSHTAGKTKLNMTYALGYSWGGAGVAMDYINRTLELNFGVKVDYNVEVNIYDFPDLVDLMGGVDIELTQAEADYLNRDDMLFYIDYKVQPGMSHLDGWGALFYARMRKAVGDNDSDIIRTERQRKLMRILIDKLRNMSLGEIQGLMERALPLITTNMDPDTITSLVFKLVPMLPSLEITTGVCPHESWGSVKDIFGNGDQHSILEFNPAAEKAYMMPITEGIPAS